MAGDTVRSILRLQTPSRHAQDYLVRNGFSTGSFASPAELTEKLNPADAEGRSVLAELCDLAGKESEIWSPSRSIEFYLDAAYHASSALLDADGLPLDRRAEVVSIYNHAVTRFLRKTSGWRLRPDDAWEQKLYRRGMQVSVRRDEVVWSPEPFDEFIVSKDYMAVGVPDRKRDGIGVPLSAVRKRWWRDPERQNGPERFLPPLQVYPVTAVLRFLPGDGTQRPPALLELHNPLRFDAVELAGKAVPLAADYTTPLVYQVTQSDLERISYLGFFDPERQQHKSGLFLTHPYERGKIPIILIHGLWSSPKTWTRVINDLRADPEIRDRYQFWTFQYPTGNPFIHSAALLRQAIAEVRHEFDPDGTDAAFDQMVVIGHSMGGLISKTLIAYSEDQVWKLISERPFAELRAPPEQKEHFERVFFFEPVPCVKRVVFVAVPHRGSMLGNNWIGQLGDRIIRRPNVLVQAHQTLMKQNGSNFFTEMFMDGIPSSVKLLRTHSPLLTTVDQLPVANVPRHSIIARVAPLPVAMSTDGVVPYESSHLEGVESEKVVNGSHNCLDEPDVIAELHRILLEHVNRHVPTSSSGRNDSSVPFLTQVR
jgi:pimeloyl-ACP methyl ester carboxylesterase